MYSLDSEPNNLITQPVCIINSNIYPIIGLNTNY